ncbi:MAG: metal-dependent hydrolase [Pseudomonadota bacterium]|nr:metal-dependent hydrolase [Pseudomonadota bacterium]
MDVVTHALLGATLAHATAPDHARLGVRERLLLGGAAAAFPDIDFVAFPLNPLRFLADWHQGPTHSLALLPLWSLLLGGVFVLITRRRGVFAEAVWVSAMGLASHIAADLITAYGTALLSPLSDSRYSLGTTFVIDPLFTTVLALGLATSLWTGRRLVAGLGLAVLCVYVGGQALLQQRAIDLGLASARAQGLAIEQLSVLPQPFSPFNWKLIGVQGPLRFVAHVNLAGHPPMVPSLPGMRRLAAIAAAYEPPAQLTWRRRHHFGDWPEHQALAEQLWLHPQFATFRRFAVHPAISRIDSRGDETCVWYTDLRYDLPALPDTFRFGFCRDGVERPWRPYRLRYFSERDRQALPQ